MQLMGDDQDERVISSFAARLDEYSAGLSARERQALQTLLIRAMDPLERMRWRDAAKILDQGEQSVLQDLMNGEAQR